MPPTSLLERIAGWRWEEPLLVVFAFAWGAMLGSFINVVAHRLPLGRSPLAGRSRCPRCGAAVRFRDNVPVFAWLILQGRCRDCGAGISAAYVLVEAGCGGSAAVLAAAAVAEPGTADRLLQGDLRPLACWALRLAAILFVVTRSMLARTAAADGVRGVSSSGFGALGTAATLAMVLACTAAVPACGPPDWPGWCGWPGDPLPAVLGGSLAGWAWGLARTPRQRGNLVILGSVLGWQGVTLVAIVTTAACLSAGPRRCPDWAAGIGAAAVATAILVARGWPAP